MKQKIAILLSTGAIAVFSGLYGLLTFSFYDSLLKKIASVALMLFSLILLFILIFGRK